MERNILLFLFFLTVAIVVMYFAAKHKKESFLDRITDKFTIVTGILAAFGIYLTYRVFQKQSDNTANDITLRLIDRAWIGVNRELARDASKCRTLANSLYFDWQRKNLGTNNSNNNNNNNQDDWATCAYLSNLIFQSWEDFLTLGSVDETEDQVWIANFIQWAQSNILRNNWNLLKANYSSTTIELGDYLFRIVSSYIPKNEIEHMSLSKQIMQSEEFKNIRHKRNLIGEGGVQREFSLF